MELPRTLLLESLTLADRTEATILQLRDTVSRTGSAIVSPAVWNSQPQREQPLDLLSLSLSPTGMTPDGRS